NLPGAQRGVVEQRARSGERVWPARADRRGTEIGLDHVPCPAEDEGAFDVRDHQERLEPAEEAVRPPVLAQLHAGAGEVVLVLLELRLEALEEGEGVGGAAGESGEDATVAEAAHLPRAGLHHRLVQRDLAVAAEPPPPVAADAENGRSVEHREIARPSNSRVAGVPSPSAKKRRITEGPCRSPEPWAEAPGHRPGGCGRRSRRRSTRVRRADVSGRTPPGAARCSPGCTSGSWRGSRGRATPG